MTTIKKILSGLILTTFCACNSSTKIENATHGSVTFIDGHYQIDTAIILTNKNLRTLIAAIETTDLTEKKKVSEIPVFIKSFLDSLTKGFSIASPDENWQNSDVIMGKLIQKKVYDKKTGDTLIEITFDNSQPLPSRKLIYFGLGKDIALMVYHTGGWGKLQHMLIIKFDVNKITDFYGSNIPTDITTKTEIFKYLKDNKTSDWTRNTNIFSL